MQIKRLPVLKPEAILFSSVALYTKRPWKFDTHFFSKYLKAVPSVRLFILNPNPPFSRQIIKMNASFPAGKCNNPEFHSYQAFEG
jgi:hypothetical protein